MNIEQSSVNMVQVVEHLTGKGLSQEEAIEVDYRNNVHINHSYCIQIQFFNEIDREGEGQVDIAYLLMVRCFIFERCYQLTTLGSEGYFC